MRYFMVILVLVVLMLNPLWAQLPGGLFIGGGVGSSFVETKPTDIGGQDLKLDGNGFAYKFFAGYKFVRLIGVEAGYRSLGNIKNTVQNVEFESKVKGFDVFGTATLNFTMLEIFGKAGYFFADTELKIDDVPTDKSSSEFAWGFGAGLSFGKLGVRAEWENLKVEGFENPSMLTVSLIYIVM
jgi:opacity protein-like surface antigen